MVKELSLLHSNSRKARYNGIMVLLLEEGFDVGRDGYAM